MLDLALFLDRETWVCTGPKSDCRSTSRAMTADGLYPEHDIFIQMAKLKNTLRYLRGEDLITHLGLDYYED